jgi:hypothetical protein
LLGIGALFLVFKSLYFGGIYDTWAPGGGRCKKNYQLDPYPSVIFVYLLKSPYISLPGHQIKILAKGCSWRRKMSLRNVPSRMMALALRFSNTFKIPIFAK